jgi:hypothetical protein
MTKKATSAAEPKPVEKKTPVEARSEPKKPTSKKPINPFTADKGRSLGRAGKNGPSRTAWKT